MSGIKKKKCRRYNVDYLKFGFVPSKTDVRLPACILCDKVLSNDSMKPSKLKDHLKRCHPDKTTKDLKYFQGLKDRRQERQLEMANRKENGSEDGQKPFTPVNEPHLPPTSKSPRTANVNDDILRTSYNISLLIAKTGKPHVTGQELMSSADEDSLKSSPFDGIKGKRIPLSNKTVQRRIDEMSSDVESFLCRHLQRNHFSIQLDEAAIPGYREPLLLAYVRFIMDEQIRQELLFAKYLETDPQGESTFNLLIHFLKEKSIPLTNVVSVATDGSSATVGHRHRGLMAHLRRLVPGVMGIHTVIHRQHLVGRNLSERLNRSLEFVTDAVNKIRNDGSNTRLFAELCGHDDEDEDFGHSERFLLHGEPRWLSRGASLTRFYSAFDSVLEFLEGKEADLKENLRRSKGDVAYLTDFLDKFNDVNSELQGNGFNLIKTKSVISAFVGKVKFMRENLGRGRFSQFSNLSRLECIEDEDVQTYVEHLEALEGDLRVRFQDVLAVETPPWMVNPFEETEGCLDNVSLREELIELSTNEELKVAFRRGYQRFWLQSAIPDKYPGLWSIARKIVIAFPTSSVVEKGFRVVMNLIKKKRNRLNVTERGDLRLFLTKLKPNIDGLLSIHQVHPSH